MNDVFSVNCVIMCVRVCVFVRVLHIFIPPWIFMLEICSVYLQKNLSNSRPLPNSSCLREAPHCCSRRAGR